MVLALLRLKNQSDGDMRQGNVQLSVSLSLLQFPPHVYFPFNLPHSSSTATSSTYSQTLILSPFFLPPFLIIPSLLHYSCFSSLYFPFVFTSHVPLCLPPRRPPRSGVFNCVTYPDGPAAPGSQDRQSLVSLVNLIRPSPSLPPSIIKPPLTPRPRLLLVLSFDRLLFLSRYGRLFQ